MSAYERPDIEREGRGEGAGAERGVGLAEVPVKHGQTRATMNDEYLRLGWVHEVELDAYPAIRVPGAAAAGREAVSVAFLGRHLHRKGLGVDNVAVEAKCLSVDAQGEADKLG